MTEEPLDKVAASRREQARPSDVAAALDAINWLRYVVKRLRLLT